MNERFFRFNTGRFYSPTGQRIYCLAEDGHGFVRIYFRDVTRMITGMVQWRTDRALDTYADWSLEANVMTHYDRCAYSYPPELERKVAEIEQHYKER
jgi:hypothetical protein